jgi:hypothetical protein
LEGLASDEAHIHPIKTFIEVSSGRLSAGDQILMSSPELLALFSLEELNKHASRMDGERFSQFLKTALVNELDMAGLMVVDVTENLTPKSESRSEKKSEDPAPVRVNNVFSQSALMLKTQRNTVYQAVLSSSRVPEEEYIDNKTGHICPR